MPRTWLLTDSHLNHVNMAKKAWRVPDYQERLRRHCMELIAPDDQVKHLGDVIMGPTEPLKEWLAEMPGTWDLIRGNHDHRSDATYRAMGFAGVYDAAVVPSTMGDIYLTHQPAYNLLRDTVLNIHGHLHDDDHRLVDYDGVYPQPWHRLLAMEYTDYSPVLLEEFIRTPGNYKGVPCTL